MTRINVRVKTLENENFICSMPKKSFERMKFFSSIYSLEKVLNGNDNITLGSEIPNNKRYCRFCKIKFSKENFSKEAHVITQSMNRSKPLSNFECDKCNEDIFSIYESDFGQYFLVERILFSKKKKQGKPKFKTKDGTSLITVPVDNLKDIDFSDLNQKNSLIKFIKENKAKVVFINQGKDDKEIKINDNNIEFNLVRKPYRPLNIYRVFVKIALSLIKENELASFSSQFNLLNPEFKIPPKDNYKEKSILMHEYEIPLYKDIFEYPIVYLYNKISKYNINYPDKYLVIFYSNKIFGIPIFSDKNYKKKFENKENLELALFPPFLNPLFSKKMFDHKGLSKELEKIRIKKVELYNSELVKDDVQNFTLKQYSIFTDI